jgi:hypothetical protein
MSNFERLMRIAIAASIAVAAIAAGAARAETAVIAWDQQVGITDYDEAGYYSPATIMVPDAAGNSVYVGRGRTSDGTATWVNKLSAAGSLIWWSDLGEAVGATLATDAVTDKFGNVFVAGSTSESLGGSNQGGTDGFVAKLGSVDGAPAWIRQIGTAADEGVTKIGRDEKGNIYVAMRGSLVKLAPSGTVVWQKTMGATHLRIDAAGNPIVAGTDAAGKNWVSKRLPNGGLAWKKSLTGPASTLVLDSLGRVIVGYGSQIAKYSESGMLEWKRTRTAYSNISTDVNGDVYVMTGPKTLSKFSGADGTSTGAGTSISTTAIASVTCDRIAPARAPSSEPRHPIPAPTSIFTGPPSTMPTAT